MIGVVLTEIGSVDTQTLRTTMLAKVTSALRAKFNPSEMDEIRIAFHVFPEDTDAKNGGSSHALVELYPDLRRENVMRRAARILKRGIDIVGSLTAVTALSPVLMAIALAIKLTSKGTHTVQGSRGSANTVSPSRF
ncbi:MAG: sugar transferase [Rhodopseudomonas palustris]|nr:sugar transferase [Rhodopseudomonas palustris]